MANNKKYQLFDESKIGKDIREGLRGIDRNNPISAKQMRNASVIKKLSDKGISLAKLEMDIIKALPENAKPSDYNDALGKVLNSTEYAKNKYDILGDSTTLSVLRENTKDAWTPKPQKPVEIASDALSNKESSWLDSGISGKAGQLAEGALKAGRDFLKGAFGSTSNQLEEAKNRVLSASPETREYVEQQRFAEQLRKQMAEIDNNSSLDTMDRINALQSYKRMLDPVEQNLARNAHLASSAQSYLQDIKTYQNLHDQYQWEKGSGILTNVNDANRLSKAQEDINKQVIKNNVLNATGSTDFIDDYNHVNWANVWEHTKNAFSNLANGTGFEELGYSMPAIAAMSAVTAATGGGSLAAAAAGGAYLLGDMNNQFNENIFQKFAENPEGTDPEEMANELTFALGYVIDTAGDTIAMGALGRLIKPLVNKAVALTKSELRALPGTDGSRLLRNNIERAISEDKRASSYFRKLGHIGAEIIKSPYTAGKKLNEAIDRRPFLAATRDLTKAVGKETVGEFAQEAAASGISTAVEDYAITGEVDKNAAIESAIEGGAAGVGFVGVGGVKAVGTHLAKNTLGKAIAYKTGVDMSQYKPLTEKEIIAAHKGAKTINEVPEAQRDIIASQARRKITGIDAEIEKRQDAFAKAIGRDKSSLAFGSDGTYDVDALIDANNQEVDPAKKLSDKEIKKIAKEAKKYNATVKTLSEAKTENDKLAKRMESVSTENADNSVRSLLGMDKDGNLAKGLSKANAHDLFNKDGGKGLVDLDRASPEIQNMAAKLLDISVDHLKELTAEARGKGKEQTAKDLNVAEDTFNKLQEAKKQGKLNAPVSLFKDLSKDAQDAINKGDWDKAYNEIDKNGTKALKSFFKDKDALKNSLEVITKKPDATVKDIVKDSQKISDTVKNNKNIKPNTFVDLKDDIDSGLDLQNIDDVKNAIKAKNANLTEGDITAQANIYKAEADNRINAINKQNELDYNKTLAKSQRTLWKYDEMPLDTFEDVMEKTVNVDKTDGTKTVDKVKDKENNDTNRIQKLSNIFKEIGDITASTQYSSEKTRTTDIDAKVDEAKAIIDEINENLNHIDPKNLSKKEKGIIDNLKKTVEVLSKNKGKSYNLNMLSKLSKAFDEGTTGKNSILNTYSQNKLSKAKVKKAHGYATSDEERAQTAVQADALKKILKAAEDEAEARKTTRADTKKKFPGLTELVNATTVAERKKAIKEVVDAISDIDVGSDRTLSQVLDELNKVLNSNQGITDAVALQQAIQSWNNIELPSDFEAIISEIITQINFLGSENITDDIKNIREQLNLLPKVLNGLGNKVSYLNSTDTSSLMEVHRSLRSSKSISRTEWNSIKRSLQNISNISSRLNVKVDEFLNVQGLTGDTAFDLLFDSRIGSFDDVQNIIKHRGVGLIEHFMSNFVQTATVDQNKLSKWIMSLANLNYLDNGVKNALDEIIERMEQESLSDQTVIEALKEIRKNPTNATVVTNALTRILPEPETKGILLRTLLTDPLILLMSGMVKYNASETLDTNLDIDSIFATLTGKDADKKNRLIGFFRTVKTSMQTDLTEGRAVLQLSTNLLDSLGIDTSTGDGTEDIGYYLTALEALKTGSYMSEELADSLMRVAIIPQLNPAKTPGIDQNNSSQVDTIIGKLIKQYGYNLLTNNEIDQAFNDLGLDDKYKGLVKKNLGSLIYNYRLAIFQKQIKNNPNSLSSSAAIQTLDQLETVAKFKGHSALTYNTYDPDVFSDKKDYTETDYFTALNIIKENNNTKEFLDTLAKSTDPSIPQETIDLVKTHLEHKGDLTSATELSKPDISKKAFKDMMILATIYINTNNLNNTSTSTKGKGNGNYTPKSVTGNGISSRAKKSFKHYFKKGGNSVLTNISIDEALAGSDPDLIELANKISSWLSTLDCSKETPLRRIFQSYISNGKIPEPICNIVAVAAIQSMPLLTGEISEDFKSKLQKDNPQLLSYYLNNKIMDFNELKNSLGNTIARSIGLSKRAIGELGFGALSDELGSLGLMALQASGAVSLELVHTNKDGKAVGTPMAKGQMTKGIKAVKINETKKGQLATKVLNNTYTDSKGKTIKILDEVLAIEPNVEETITADTFDKIQSKRFNAYNNSSGNNIVESTIPFTVGKDGKPSSMCTIQYDPESELYLVSLPKTLFKNKNTDHLTKDSNNSNNMIIFLSDRDVTKKDGTKLTNEQILKVAYDCASPKYVDKQVAKQVYGPFEKVTREGLRKLVDKLSVEDSTYTSEERLILSRVGIDPDTLFDDIQGGATERANKRQAILNKLLTMKQNQEFYTNLINANPNAKTLTVYFSELMAVNNRSTVHGKEMNYREDPLTRPIYNYTVKNEQYTVDEDSAFGFKCAILSHLGVSVDKLTPKKIEEIYENLLKNEDKFNALLDAISKNDLDAFKNVDLSFLGTKLDPIHLDSERIKLAKELAKYPNLKLSKYTTLNTPVPSLNIRIEIDGLTNGMGIQSMKGYMPNRRNSGESLRQLLAVGIIANKKAGGNHSFVDLKDEFSNFGDGIDDTYMNGAYYARVMALEKSYLDGILTGTDNRDAFYSLAAAYGEPITATDSAEIIKEKLSRSYMKVAVMTTGYGAGADATTLRYNQELNAAIGHLFYRMYRGTEADKTAFRNWYIEAKKLNGGKPLYAKNTLTGKTINLDDITNISKNDWLSLDFDISLPQNSGYYTAMREKVFEPIVKGIKKELEPVTELNKLTQETFKEVAKYVSYEIKKALSENIDEKTTLKEIDDIVNNILDTIDPVLNIGVEGSALKMIKADLKAELYTISSAVITDPKGKALIKTEFNVHNYQDLGAGGTAMGTHTIDSAIMQATQRALINNNMNVLGVHDAVIANGNFATPAGLELNYHFLDESIFSYKTIESKNRVLKRTLEQAIANNAPADMIRSLTSLYRRNSNELMNLRMSKLEWLTHIKALVDAGGEYVVGQYALGNNTALVFNNDLANAENMAYLNQCIQVLTDDIVGTTDMDLNLADFATFLSLPSTAGSISNSDKLYSNVSTQTTVTNYKLRQEIADLVKLKKVNSIDQFLDVLVDGGYITSTEATNLRNSYIQSQANTLTTGMSDVMDALAQIRTQTKDPKNTARGALKSLQKDGGSDILTALGNLLTMSSYQTETEVDTSNAQNPSAYVKSFFDFGLIMGKGDEVAMEAMERALKAMALYIGKAGGISNTHLLTMLSLMSNPANINSNQISSFLSVVGDLGMGVWSDNIRVGIDDSIKKGLIIMGNALPEIDWVELEKYLAHQNTLHNTESGYSAREVWMAQFTKQVEDMYKELGENDQVVFDMTSKTQALAVHVIQTLQIQGKLKNFKLAVCPAITDNTNPEVSVQCQMAVRVAANFPGRVRIWGSTIPNEYFDRKSVGMAIGTNFSRNYIENNTDSGASNFKVRNRNNPTSMKTLDVPYSSMHSYGNKVFKYTENGFIRSTVDASVTSFKDFNIADLEQKPINALRHSLIADELYMSDEADAIIADGKMYNEEVCSEYGVTENDLERRISNIHEDGNLDQVINLGDKNSPSDIVISMNSSGEGKDSKIQALLNSQPELREAYRVYRQRYEERLTDYKSGKIDTFAKFCTPIVVRSVEPDAQGRYKTFIFKVDKITSITREQLSDLVSYSVHYNSIGNDDGTNVRGKTAQKLSNTGIKLFDANQLDAVAEFVKSVSKGNADRDIIQIPSYLQTKDKSLTVSDKEIYARNEMVISREFDLNTKGGYTYITSFNTNTLKAVNPKDGKGEGLIFPTKLWGDAGVVTILDTSKASIKSMQIIAQETAQETTNIKKRGLAVRMRQLLHMPERTITTQNAYDVAGSRIARSAFRDYTKHDTQQTLIDLMNLDAQYGIDTSHIQPLMPFITNLAMNLRVYSSRAMGRDGGETLVWNARERAVYIAHGVLEHGQGSSAEIFAHEIMHGIFEHINLDASLSRQASQLYQYALQNLSIDDFECSREEAMRIMRHIREAKDGLSEFYAYALTNKDIQTAISNMAKHAPVESNIFDSRLQTISNKIQAFFGSEPRTQGEAPKDLNAAIRDVFNVAVTVSNIVWNAQKHQKIVQDSSLEAMGQQQDIVSNALNAIAKGILPNYFMSMSEASQYSGIPANTVVEKLTDGLRSLSKKKTGFIAELATSLEGVSMRNWDYIKLRLFCKKQLDATRESGAASVANYVEDLLKDVPKKIINQLITNFLRADVSCLYRYESADRATQLLKDSSFRKDKIAQLEKLLKHEQFGNFYIRASKGLSDYTIKGTNTLGIGYKNSIEIATMAGSKYEIPYRRVPMHILNAIDELTTLYSVDTISREQDNFYSQLPNNILQELSTLTNGIKDQERTQVYKSNDAQLLHIPKGEIHGGNTRGEYKVYNAIHEKALKWSTPTRMKPTKLDPLAQQLSNGNSFLTVHHRFRGPTPIEAGVFALTDIYRGRTQRGARIAGERVGTEKNDPNVVSHVRNYLTTRIDNLNSISPSYWDQETDGMTVPTFGITGRLNGAKFELNPITSDDKVGRTMIFSKMLGDMYGSNLERISVPETNQKIAEAMYQLYEQNKTDKEHKYVWVSDSSTDPEIRDYYDSMPLEVKNFFRAKFKGKGIPVLESALTIACGHKLSTVKKIDYDYYEKESVELENAYNSIADKFAKYIQHLSRFGWFGIAEDAAAIGTSWFKETMLARAIEAAVAVMNLGSNLVTHRIEGISMAQTMGLYGEGIEQLMYLSDYSMQLSQLNIKKINHTYTSQDALKEKAINDSLTKLKMYPLIHTGALGSIMDDISNSERMVKSLIEKYVPQAFEGLAHNMALTSKSKVYKLMYLLNSAADQLAMYTTYYSLPNTLDHDEKLRIAKSNVIDYGIPLPTGLDYMERIGMSNFLKYPLGVQSVLARLSISKPGNVLGFLLAQKALGINVPDVFDSALGINVVNRGLKVPGIENVGDGISQLSTVKLANAIME